MPLGKSKLNSKRLTWMLLLVLVSLWLFIIVFSSVFNDSTQALITDDKTNIASEIESNMKEEIDKNEFVNKELTDEENNVNNEDIGNKKQPNTKPATSSFKSNPAILLGDGVPVELLLEAIGINERTL